jgi:hypothetical protein
MASSPLSSAWCSARAGLFLAVAAAQAVPVLAQSAPVRKNQLSLDVGLLEGGVSYARRVGQGPFSIGGGAWFSWEPWNSFEENVWEAIGAELFVRAQPSRDVHFELGPSLLRYRWEDDCSECDGTFAGLRAAAMVGQGIFSLGPAFRLGRISGSPAGSEVGILWGIQGRLLFSWGK